jgi:hypothetical protein
MMRLLEMEIILDRKAGVSKEQWRRAFSEVQQTDNSNKPGGKFPQVNWQQKNQANMNTAMSA